MSMGRIFNIELSVAITIFFFTCSSTLEGLLPTIAPSYSIICTFLRYLTALHIVFYQWTHYHEFVIDKKFLLFFIIYSFYILYDITLGLVYPLDDMLSVPDNVGDFLFRTIYIISLMICSKTIIEKISFKKIIIIFTVFCLIPALIYINIVGFETFQVINEANREARFIGSLTFAYNCAFVLVMYVFFVKYIFKWKILNFILLSVVLFCIGYIYLASTKRGPILWSIVSILTCYFFQSKRSFKFFFKLFLFLVFFFIVGDYLLNALSQFAPYSIGRIHAMIYEGDTSHRLTTGDSDNGYVIAIKQFANAPFFGSYFILIRGGGSIFRGAYPHNLFLEFMITMGLVGIIPILIILRRALKGMHIVFKYNNNKNYLVCFIIFCISFYTLMTTGTICLNPSFWISLSLILVIPKLKCYE